MASGVDRLARFALGLCLGLLAVGLFAGKPVFEATGPSAGMAQPSDPRGGLADSRQPAADSHTPRPLDVVLPPSAGAGEPAQPDWAGPSVARRQDTPDQVSRPPDDPWRAFTLAATGDLLIHSQVRGQAALPNGGFDFAPQLADVAPVISQADLGLCHLEVPLDPDGPYTSYPIFNAPAELADAIVATGWDACSTASNHAADRGEAGITSTLDALDRVGLAHRGMARSALEALSPRLLDIQGVSVGLLSATYGLNGLPQPGGDAWSVQAIDTEVLIDRAEQLRAAGAEVVIQSLHWGNEYQHTPSEFQQDVAQELLGSGLIDAIIGHHAHVVQPVEWIDDRPVVYGLGNFLSGQRPTERRDGVIVTLAFEEDTDGWHVTRVEAQPTWVDDAYRVVIADQTDEGILGASAARTLGYLGVEE